MKIDIPSTEVSHREKRMKFLKFLVGVCFGNVIFGLASSRFLFSSIYQVEIYTWAALGTGVLTFGFLAMSFGSDYWKTILKLFKY